MTDDQKKWIDDADYETLLRRWRTATVGDPIFQGEIGKYYADALMRKRDEDPGAAVRASKNIGW